MKILFLANAADIHTVRWVNTLTDREHEVHLAFNFDHKPKDNKISQKVIQHRLKYSGTKAYFMNAFELRRLFKKIKPDIVNAHYASGYGTLARLAKINQLILSVYGSDVYDFPYQSKLRMNIIKKNLLYATKIASTSHCMANQVNRLLGPVKVDITVTPFGVDTEIFSSRKKYKNNGKIYIGNIKKFDPKYGITDLIKAIKVLKEDLEKNGLVDISNNIIVPIYGDGIQKDEIISLIDRLQLNDTVELKGRIPNSEVPMALKKMNIFCVASVNDSESFGVAAVEAMAMELPVVATDVDGFKEVVEDGITGIIVERKNVQALANALRKLVLDPTLCETMGKAGRKRVLKMYDWKDNVGVMEGLYNEVIHCFTN
jgi:L-malate glycosyltransferase